MHRVVANGPDVTFRRVDGLPRGDDGAAGSTDLDYVVAGTEEMLDLNGGVELGRDLDEELDYAVMADEVATPCQRGVLVDRDVICADSEDRFDVLVGERVVDRLNEFDVFVRFSPLSARVRCSPAHDL